MRSDRVTTDIVVSGGGIAGLVAAATLGSAGFDVVCTSADPSTTPGEESSRDNRTTAFLQPARSTLEEAKIWHRVSDHAMPLQVLTILDAGGHKNRIRYRARFDAAEISDRPFGWNVTNGVVRNAIVDRILELPNVLLKSGTLTRQICPRTRDVVVDLTDGSVISCRLLIGADGRDSHVRNAMGIGVRSWRYGQRALAGSVFHKQPHESESLEIYLSGGPMTLVPMTCDSGRFRSALIWMDAAKRIELLSQLPQTEFNRELTARSCGVLGDLEVAGPRSCWPVVGQLAHRLTGQRTVILAEAAHVVPPIGAQGLNMSLTDIQTLCDIIRSSNLDPGSPTVIGQFSRRRWPDILARVTAVELLNRASIAGNPVIGSLRLHALKTLHQNAVMRKPFMRAGLGRIA